MRFRWPVFAVLVLSSGLLGVDACFYPIPDLTGISIIDDPDSRCAPLASTHPPSLAFDLTAEQVWVVDPAPSHLVPFAVETPPPTLAPVGTFTLPPDSDSDALFDGPILNDIQFIESVGIAGIPNSIALLTASGYDEVLFFDASIPRLFQFQISVPSMLDDPQYPRFPAPGASPVSRSALPTVACVNPGGRLDSLGFDIPIGEGECAGFYTSSTSGAAFSGGRLFVSMANPGSDIDGPSPQYFPGTVLVYSISASDGMSVGPDPDVPVIFTSGYNPTQVSSYSVGGRDFVLVTVSGAIKTVKDLAGTPVTEGGYEASTDASIDVIDAESRELVATIPLGPAGLVGNLVIHPDGFAAVGSLIDRWVLAVDLEPLADPTLPDMGPPVTLGGPDRDLSFSDAVIHDAMTPIEIPARGDGAAEITCPGLIAGLAFNDAENLLFATDFCDGTLSVIGLTPLSSPPSLSHQQLISITAPMDTLDADTPHGLGAIAVRPGVPNSGFTGPDVFVLVGEPSGLLCSVAIESGS